MVKVIVNTDRLSRKCKSVQYVTHMRHSSCCKLRAYSDILVNLLILTVS